MCHCLRSHHLFHGGRHHLLVCRTERIAERQAGVLLQVHLADDLVVAGPAEGLPIVVASQRVVAQPRVRAEVGREG